MRSQLFCLVIGKIKPYTILVKDAHSHHGQHRGESSGGEDEAIEQIRRMCDHEFTENSCIRIMPDMHSGMGCAIGTTMTIVDKVVPNIVGVGVDVGCGMYTVELGKVDIDFERVDQDAHYISSGKNVWEGRQERFDLTELRCCRHLKDTRRGDLRQHPVRLP